MCETIKVGNFLASKDDKGNWIYKANESRRLIKKVNPKYREEPQFKIQHNIEGVGKAHFKLQINKIVLEIIKLIK